MLRYSIATSLLAIVLAAATLTPTGPVGDGKTDDTEAIQKLLDGTDPVVTLGQGTFLVNKTLTIKRTLTLKGQCASNPRVVATAATVVMSSAEGPALFIAPGGLHAKVQGMFFQSKGAKSHGCMINGTRVCVEDCGFTRFPGDGLRIEANTPEVPAPPSNANHWSLTRVACLSNGGNGVSVYGADSNAGLAMLVECSGNKKWGYESDRALGHTLIACQSDSNTLGAFRLAGNSNQMTAIGLYAERGQPGSRLGPRAISIGGVHGAGWDNVTEPWPGAAIDSIGSGLRMTAVGPTYRRLGPNSSIKEVTGSGPPITGDWTRGDRIMNYVPAPGYPVSWVCVQSGAPGSWRAEYTLPRP